MSANHRWAPEELEYPCSDGEPIAESTRQQFGWITGIKMSLDFVFRDRPDVFIAGPLLWYPIEGNKRTRAAPDVMVALGRPRGDRLSYMQWREGDIAPQIVFEVLPPRDCAEELARKFAFYERFGVQEYYILDPETEARRGWTRAAGALERIPAMVGWVSPLPRVRFEREADPFGIIAPDGQPFRTCLEWLYGVRRDEVDRRRAEAQQRRIDRMEAKLRALGVDPEG